MWRKRLPSARRDGHRRAVWLSKYINAVAFAAVVICAVVTIAVVKLPSSGLQSRQFRLRLQRRSKYVILACTSRTHPARTLE